MEEKANYIVHKSKRKYLMRMSFYLVLVCLGFWCLDPNPSSTPVERYGILAVRMIAVFGILLFGLIVIYCIKEAFSKKEVMILSKEGIWFDNLPPLGFIGTISWDEIYDIQEEPIKETTFEFYYKDKHKRAKRKRWSYFLGDYDEMAKIRLVHIKEDIKEVRKIIYEYWECYGQMKEQPNIKTDEMESKAEFHDSFHHLNVNNKSKKSELTEK